MVRKKQAEAEGAPMKSRPRRAAPLTTAEMGGLQKMEDNELRGPTLEKKIGRTTYKVTSVYSRNATETAVQKMQRLILKDAEKVLKNVK